MTPFLAGHIMGGSEGCVHARIFKETHEIDPEERGMLVIDGDTVPLFKNLPSASGTPPVTGRVPLNPSGRSCIMGCLRSRITKTRRSVPLNHSTRSGIMGCLRAQNTKKGRSVPLTHSRWSGIIGMDSSGFMDPRDRFLAIARGEDISYIRSEIPSAENRGEIISPCQGATA